MLDKIAFYGDFDVSLYADYIKEREGKEIVENSKGFATYSLQGDGYYIEDIFVKPEHRKEGVAAQLADIIAEIAISKGVKKLYGSVCPFTAGSTTSIKVLIAYGFKLHSAQTNMIYLVKDI